MKILFLHLSDLHIKSKEAVSKNHIDKILDTLRIYGSFDKLFLIFSGDIAFSGESEQYKAGSSLVAYIFREIKNKNIYTKKIEMVCVPGNHDIEYEIPPRSAKELNAIYNDFSYNKHLDEELSKQKNFFEFSKRSKCFCNKSVFDRKLVNVDGFVIEVNMLNSAVFSLMKDEDKGLHYIDQSAINELNTPSGADFVISVMHHAPDWYIDAQKDQIETALLCKSSLIFLGHEHKAGTRNCSYNDKAAAFIHAGGSLCNNSDWTNSEFEVGVLDTQTLEYSTTLFKWNPSELQYEENKGISKKLPSKKSIEKALIVTEEYNQNLFNDAHRSFSSNSQDYYVFPRLETETYESNGNKEFLDIESFIAEIQKKHQVLITGGNNSGKSLLLKNLFSKLTGLGKCVVLCDIDTIKRKESSKIVKSNFEDIYGDDFSDYNRFKQLPPENKVLIIDDIDQIKQQDFENYIAGIANQFGLMIFATKDVLDLDMLKRMKTALKSKNSIGKYKIEPFFADKRKELIEKLVILKSKKDPSIVVDKTVETLCESIKLQKRYINLEPEFIINFVEYYCNNVGTALNSDSTVFSKVFESNITNSLNAFKTKELSVDKLYKLLSKLARHIHFNKMYPVTEQEIIHIVGEYNTVFDDVVRPLSFIEIVKNARILVPDINGYKFANRNHLAYFCAREVNFLYNNTGNEDDIKYLIEYCCFGINADILMFISYITDNTRILQFVLNMTQEMTREWKEFNFKDNCPKFLNLSQEQNVSLPNKNSKKENEREEIENEKVSNEKLQTIDIYDYDEKEVEKTINQIIRSLSLLAIISKCLPGFEHNMDASMRRLFVSEIYTLPNKIYGMWAQEVDSVYYELIEYLKEQEQVQYQNEEAKKSTEIELKFKLVASLLLLDIYNIAINYATRENSFRLLDNFERNGNPTYEIQNLMMVERQRLSERFVQDSVSLYESFDQNISRFLLKNIVKHAYINMDSLDFKMLNKLDSAFFQSGASGKRRTLPEQKSMLFKRSKNGKRGD